MRVTETDLSPEGTVRRLFEALNSRDYAAAANAIAPFCEWESVPTGKVFIGPSVILAGLREFSGAFPDWRADLERVTAAGNIAVAEWDSSGTFAEPFRGHEANGKKFRRRGCSVAEVEAGRIVRYRDYYDRAALLQQLDLIALL